MPTTLGRPYDIHWEGRPPHMLQPDIPPWYRFLKKWGSLFENLYYDCLLGGPELTKEEERDPLKRMWRYNLCKRADAIAELKDEVWIIEVSDEPRLRAIGQVQTYRTLWTRDTPIQKPEKCVLVGSHIDPDLLDACGMYGILVFLV